MSVMSLEKLNPTASTPAIDVSDQGTERRAWYYRPPRDGGFLESFLSDGLLTAEFGVRADLSEHFDSGLIEDEVAAANPHEKKTRVSSMARQLEALVNDIQPGDVVLCSRPDIRGFSVAMVRGQAFCDAQGRPAREVEWLKKNVEKSALLPDITQKASTHVHITELKASNVIARLKRVIADEQDPGPEMHAARGVASLSEISFRKRANITSRIASRFDGQDMAHLVREILQAEGMTAETGPVGPDGGIDIMAGSGPLGLGAPRIVCQVKSGGQVVGDETLQALIGNMHASGADAALLVSWSGTTRQLQARAAAQGFRVMIWTAEHVVERLLTGYENMPDWVRARVPLKVHVIHELDGSLTGPGKNT